MQDFRSTGLLLVESERGLPSHHSHRTLRQTQRTPTAESPIFLGLFTDASLLLPNHPRGSNQQVLPTDYLCQV
jgi:hypothetical protein